MLIFHWRTFLVALFLSAVGSTAIWTAYPPVYQTNDDVSIRLALEGHTAPGEPATGFTALTHALLGWSVVELYRFFPTAFWWDVVVASLFIAALAVALAIGWQLLNDDWLARILSVGVVLVAAVPLMVTFQYTVGATLGGGVAVFLAVIEMASPGNARRGVLLFAVLLLLSALLVRTLGAAAGIAAAGLFCVPFVLARIVPLKPAVVVLAAAAVLGAAVQYADNVLHMTDDRWSAYQHYQWMLVRLFEWRGELPQGDVDVIRAAAGWTNNDWRMIPGYFGVDPSLHGYDQVARAYEASTFSFGWVDWFNWAGARIRGIDMATVRSMAERSLAPLAVVAAAVVGYASRRGSAVVIAIVLLFLALCVGIETAFKELPIRLLGPLQVCAVVAAMIAVSVRRRRPSPLRAILALGLVLSVLGQQFADTVRAAESVAQDSRALDEEVGELLRRLSPSLLVLHADTFPREHWWRPFQRPSVDLPAIALTWNNQNPLLQDFLRKSGRPGLLRSICSDPSVLVIADEGRLDVMNIFFREHENLEIRWTDTHSGSFRAWRCSLAESAGS